MVPARHPMGALDRSLASPELRQPQVRQWCLGGPRGAKRPGTSVRKAFTGVRSPCRCAAGRPPRQGARPAYPAEVTYRLAVDLGSSNTAAVLRAPDGRIRPVLFDGGEPARLWW